jgi:hypothetical protein
MHGSFTETEGRVNQRGESTRCSSSMQLYPLFTIAAKSDRLSMK